MVYISLLRKMWVQGTYANLTTYILYDLKIIRCLKAQTETCIMLATHDDFLSLASAETPSVSKNALHDRNV